MTLSCLHTHTDFCDGTADMETMCQAAFSKGFESIGFSSHAPILKKTGIERRWHLPDEKIREYVDTALKTRKQWEGKLKVYLGLEVDYIQGLCGPMDADIQELPLDYIIGAVHYISSPKNGEFFTVDGPPEEFRFGLEQFDNDGLALCKAYYNAYNSMVNAGGCDILAHLDLVKKNNDRFQFFSPQEPEYTKLLVKTADSIAQVRTASFTPANGRLPIVEVNTGGIIRSYTAEPYPSLAILRLLKERNIPLTINADAHAPEHLGIGYETAWAALQQAGYSAVMVFQGRKGGMAVWQP
jgi:histidinol-phosphatase (PHP family)